MVKQASLQEYRAVTELELLRVEQIVERSSRYRRYPNDAITGELSLPNGERLTLESEQIAAFLPPSRSLRYGLLLIYIFDTPILQPSSGNENQVRVILCSAYAKPQ